MDSSTNIKDPAEIRNPIIPRRRRTQDERSAETRGKLIRAAIDVICESGYANTTTTQIAGRAGVSRGALQHQFGGRYELLVAVCDRLTIDMLALHQDLRKHDLALEQRVEAVLRHYWSVYTSPTFLAVMNIYLGTKNDRQLHGRLKRHLAGIDRSSEEPWLQLFSDVGMDDAELGTLRRLAMATLRGFAVARLLGIVRGSIEGELGIFKTVLVARLGHAPKLQ